MLHNCRPISVLSEAYLIYENQHREGFALLASDTYDDYLLYRQALQLKRQQ